jgi:predicted hotdog family 3-hydroxylacyl-ACP dehydratase
MMVSRREIEELLPHSGRMCLLDRVLHWDADAIRCASERHRDPENPLRSHGRLGALCGLEFAVQAMALHGRLAAGSQARARAGYVASVRDIECRCERLDRLPEGLLIEAECVMGDEAQAIYRFFLRTGERELLSGRATVVLDGGVA